MISTEEMDELIALDIELCAQSFHYFVSQAFEVLEPRRPFVDGWHIQAKCEHLEACARGEIRELLINEPPRHMKSLVVSVMFVPWVWTLAPEKRFLYASYAASLSIRDSVKTRRLVQSDWYQSRFGERYKLTGDQNAKERFENDKTGYRIATSVGGAATGEGGDFVICDDPHKVGESESKVKRKTVLDWWDNEMSTRENDPARGCKIIVGQRTHEGDLSGHVLAQGGYVHLMLPAEFEPQRKCVTSIGWEDPRTEKGELLWPDRFTPVALAKLKQRMGSRTSAGQLQQRPSPEEGDIVRREWWRYYKTLPQLDKLIQSWDLTFDETEKGSFVVGQVWGTNGADRYLVAQYRERVGFTGQIAMFEQFTNTYTEARAKYVEKKANGAALISTLKSKIQGIIPVEPHGSKVLRAEAVSPQIQSGNVYLPDPESHAWVEEFVEEWTLFPNGNNDDQVDACSQALKVLESQASYDVEIFAPTGPSKWLR